MSYSPRSRGSTATSKATAKRGVNNSGSAILKAVLVKMNASGISKVNPSIESDVDSIAGVTLDLTLDGNTTDIAASGGVENISTSFDFGSPVYLGKDGALTNQKPSLGIGTWVAGDFVVRIGVIAQNADISGQKDLIINIQILGAL